MSFLVRMMLSSSIRVNDTFIWEKILYLELSPPRHLYVLLLANLLAFYLTYLLAFYLAYLLAFYLAYLLAFYLAYLLHSSAICSGISSGTLSGISSGISSDILSGILSGKSSGICSGKHSGTLSGIPSGILSGILSGIPSGILSGISSGILSGKHSGTLSGISSGILSDILSGVLSGISSGFLSGRWGPAVLARRVPGWGPGVLTELGGSQVEVQQCSLSLEGPRLRSSELGRSQVEVQRCPARSDPQLRSSSAHCVRKLAKSLAKSWQGGSEHGSGGRGGGGEGGEEGGEEQLWTNLTTLTWQVGNENRRTCTEKLDGRGAELRPSTQESFKVAPSSGLRHLLHVTWREPKPNVFFHPQFGDLRQGHRASATNVTNAWALQIHLAQLPHFKFQHERRSRKKYEKMSYPVIPLLPWMFGAENSWFCDHGVTNTLTNWTQVGWKLVEQVWHL